MIKKLLEFFAAPIFEGDEEKTRTASLLNAIVLSSLLAALFYLPFAPMERVPYIVPAIGVILTVWLVMKRGFVRFASITMVAGISAVFLISTFTNGGIRSPEFGGLIILILFAGLLIGWKTAIGIMIFSILYGMILLGADSLGWLPAPPPFTTTYYLIIDSILFVMAGILLTLSLKLIDDAFQRVSTELKERKRAEEEILSLSRFPHENPNPVLRLTQDGMILYANPASKELLKTWKRNVGQRVTEEWREYIHQTLEHGGKSEVEIESSGKYYSCALSPVQSAGYINIYCYNITERKQAEEQIQRQLKYLSALRIIDIAISASVDSRTILDVVLQQVLSQLGVDACAVLLFNPQMRTIEYAAHRGFHGHALPDTDLRLEEGYAGPAVLERKTIHLTNLTETGSELAHALQLEHESFTDYYGTPLLVKGEVKGVLELYHRSPLYPDAHWLEYLETLAGQAAIAIDNAQLWEQVQRHARDLELRVAERTADLNRTNAELEHANRAKAEFLANMSHELRTPLNSILGLSESLLEQRRDLLTVHQQRSLQIIESSGRHLLELINDVLDLSKIEAGKLDYYPQVVDVDALCRSSLTFVKSQAVKKSITITYNETPVSKVAADPRRLKQLLVNLLTNAVKFTPERGQVTLQVAADAEKDLIQFSVIDTGIGIAPEDLKRLFQPFVQVDSSLNRQFEGTGLGLVLVQKLTDMHGGSVEVESEVGVGSRFTIKLPWSQHTIAQQQLIESNSEALTAESSEKSASPLDETPERGIVLLAEDNPANILTIAEYLASYGYKILKAHDGLEAIEKAEAHGPDLILMDIQMPVLDGLEAMRQLRANPRFAATPIIALTALAMPGDRERCLEAGADEYMSKPVSLKMLAGTIRELLGTRIAQSGTMAGLSSSLP